MMNAVKGLPADIKKKTVGGVFFGYTKNGQTKGTIAGYPKDQLQVFCAETSPGKYSDGVCGGGLNVNGGHFVYMGNGDGAKAVAFLKGKISAALDGKGGA
jgi:cutinase